MGINPLNRNFVSRANKSKRRETDKTMTELFTFKLYRHKERTTTKVEFRRAL